MRSKTNMKRKLMALVLALAVFAAAGANDAAAAELEPTQYVEPQLLSGPVLMVTDYQVIAGDRDPGSSFILQMTIANLSQLATAHNMVATLTIENTSVSLQEGYTNQHFVREIPPTEAVTLQFPLEVYTYCAEENMILSVTMSCHDDFAVHYDFQTMMTPDIEMDRSLNITSLTVPQFVHQNASMIISATLNNVEMVTLGNIRMHVVTAYGEEITEVGDLLRNESKTVDCIYRFTQQKTEDVKVYFTYESLYGQEYSTDTQSFQVVVYDPVEQDDFASSDDLSAKVILTRLFRGIPLPNTDARIPIPAIVFLLIGFGGFGRVLYVIFIKRKEA